MTAEGKALKEVYQWEAKAQWKGKPLQGDIRLSITLYFGTKRKADLDNFNKLSVDALTGSVYEDDSQIAELHLKRAYDTVRPRIELAVRPIDAASETPRKSPTEQTSRPVQSPLRRILVPDLLSRCDPGRLRALSIEPRLTSTERIPAVGELR